MSLKHELIEDLQRIKAIQIQPEHPFTWTSGLKSPIYCDNRLIMSDPVVRNKVAEGFVSLIKSAKHQPDCIAGCATAGIPHAAWVAEKLNLPMIYIRSSKKGHGKENLIEGNLRKGQKVIVIEDLISTGGSSLAAAEAVSQAGGEVLEVLAIFSYELQKAEEAFKQKSVPFQTLTGFDSLIEVLQQKQAITEKQKLILSDWQKSLSENQIFS